MSHRAVGVADDVMGTVAAWRRSAFIGLPWPMKSTGRRPVAAIDAPAADIRWAQPVSGNWGVAANWTPAQVPGAADSVSITNEGSDHSD